MKKLLLCLFILGCGSDKTTEAPQVESLQCGDLSVSFEETQELVNDAVENSVPVFESSPFSQATKSDYVVVACGGTFINDNDTTTTNVQAVKRGLSNGLIYSLEVR